LGLRSFKTDDSVSSCENKISSSSVAGSFHCFVQLQPSDQMSLLSKPSRTRWIRYVQEKYYSRAMLKALLRTGVEVEIRSHVDWCLYNDIFVDGEYDPAISCLVDSNKAKLRILDLGCNVGFFLLRVLDRLSQAGASKSLEVAAVEPDEINVSEVRRRLTQQESRRDGGLLFEVAQGLAGKKRGSELFFQTHSHHAGTVVADLSSGKKQGRRLEYVDVETRFGAEPWDLIKCDIEGAEQDFVESYPELLAQVGVFVVELHHGICELEHVERSLGDAGLHYRGCLADRTANSVHMFSRA
jgi:FkbM family methyltransferase